MKNTLEIAVKNNINAGLDISFEIDPFIKFSSRHFKIRPITAQIIPDTVNIRVTNKLFSYSMALNIGA